MKSVEELINGKEIDLEELGGRADNAQIQKVCVCYLSVSFHSFKMVFVVVITNELKFSSTIRYPAWSWGYPHLQMLLHAGSLPAMPCEMDITLPICLFLPSLLF